MIKHLAAVALPACIAACSSQPPATTVENDWADAIGRLSFTSVYPITEDLLPGDVLLVIPPPPGRAQPTIQRLGSLPSAVLKRELQAQASGRISLQSSPQVQTISTAKDAAPSTTNATGAPRRALASVEQPPSQPDVLRAGAPLGARHDQPRMRRIAVPSVVSARISEGDLAGGGSSGNVLFGIAFGHRQEAGVMVRLKQLETLGFDTLEAMRTLEQQRYAWLRNNHLSAPRLLTIAATANPALGRRLCRLDPPPAQEGRSLIQVVNRVLYAHAIEFEYLRDSQFASKVALTLASSVAAARNAVPTLPTAKPATSADNKGGGTRPAADNENAATALAEANARATSLSDALALPSAPGAQARLNVGTTGNVALVEEFAEPMAVGYDPLTSFTVRGSLLFVPLDDETVDDQARALETACAPSLPYASAGKTRPPILQLVCANTSAMRQVMPELRLPDRCLAPLPDGVTLRPSEALTPVRNPHGSQPAT